MVIPEGLKGIVNSAQPLEKSLFKNTNDDIMDSRHGGFTFVGGSGDQPIEYPIKGYYSDGALAFMMGLYGIWSVNGQPRAYTGCNGTWAVNKEQVIADSKKNGRDGLIYLIMIPDYGIARTVVPGIRNGSCV